MKKGVEDMKSHGDEQSSCTNFLKEMNGPKDETTILTSVSACEYVVGLTKKDDPITSGDGDSTSNRTLPEAMATSQTSTETSDKKIDSNKSDGPCKKGEGLKTAVTPTAPIMSSVVAAFRTYSTARRGPLIQTSNRFEQLAKDDAFIVDAEEMGLGEPQNSEYDGLEKKTMDVEDVDKHITSCLKSLKKPLRKLRSFYGNISNRVGALNIELDAIQKACDEDLANTTLLEDLVHVLLAYQQARLDEDSILRQRAKVSN
ncbi:hypothetical protein L6452_31030 [Arctium lappa]|uniref:Uncharacterized protein n=1 Tax=Arctium lappa TaxID=4217 RepID=A0ACB8ZIT7_ARCLA|nr:hypothetical protein L6452_31030 [Arctium lappa]